MKSLGRDALMRHTQPKRADASTTSRLGAADSAGATELKYMSHMMPWYGSIAGTHTGVDIIAPDSDLSRYKVVCAPVLYMLSEAQADRIRATSKAAEHSLRASGLA